MEQTNVMRCTIRDLAIEDLDAVDRIESATFTDAWPRSVFEDWLEEDWTINLAAILEGAVVGYLCAGALSDELHIHNIAVSQEYRGKGIGHQLLDHAESLAREQHKLCAILEVRPSNRTAVKFYRSHGYREVARNPQYYDSPPEDALIMFKQFTQGCRDSG